MAEVKQMTPLEIIMADAAKNPQGVSPQQAVSLFARLAQTEGVSFMRAGNSILILKDTGDGTATFHFVNADNSRDFARNIVEMMTRVAQSKKFSVLTTVFKNPKILPIIQRMPFDCDVEEKNVDEDPNPEYVLTVRF